MSLCEVLHACCSFTELLFHGVITPLAADFRPGAPAARAAMAHVRPLARASVAVLTVSVCVTFVLTVLFTYTTCVLQSQCPPLPQLPTISDTWTHPPGNFVSREAVSVLALFLMLLQCVLWLPEQPAFPHLARWCMRVGLFSAFCLSWVGAICDDGKVTLTLSLTLALALSLALTLAHPSPDPSPSPSANPNPNPNPRASSAAAMGGCTPRSRSASSSATT